jgi:hypothetical protein
MSGRTSGSAREPYVAPALVRHGTLEELTAQNGKSTQGTTDQSSTVF